MNTIRYGFLWLTVITWMRVNTRATDEASGEYLQKVMYELQELNVPSSVNSYTRLVPTMDYKSTGYPNRNSLNQRISSDIVQNYIKHRNREYQIDVVNPTDKIDLDYTDSVILPQQYQPVISKIEEPEKLGFTRAELAALYKNALEKGSAISLSSLTSAIASGAVPHATNSHVELPVKQPMYHYYFFPLKTFVSELNKDYGYKTVPHSAEDTAMTQNTQTQIMNPLFVAISTFISMAVIFMLGVLILPRIAQNFDVIHARGMPEDFLRSSDIMAKAVDRYNLLEKFAEHCLDSSRYNVTVRTKKKRRKRKSVG